MFDVAIHEEKIPFKPSNIREKTTIIEEAIFKIRESPSRYPKIENDIRRCLTKKFPYALLYTIEQDSILILAVMHCSRKPGYWKSRAKY